MEAIHEYDARIPRTIAEKVNLVYRIENAARVALIANYQINRLGNMVERYGRNLPIYTRVKNDMSAMFDILTTGIYEGKSGGQP